MSADNVHAARIERGREIIERYTAASGGVGIDWMDGAAAIADILHAVDALGIENDYAERVLDLARMHHDEERETVAEVTA